MLVTLHVLSLVVAALSLLVAVLSLQVAVRMSHRLLLLEVMLSEADTPASDSEVVDLTAAHGCRDLSRVVPLAGGIASDAARCNICGNPDCPEPNQKH